MLRAAPQVLIGEASSAADGRQVDLRVVTAVLVLGAWPEEVACSLPRRAVSLPGSTGPDRLAQQLARAACRLERSIREAPPADRQNDTEPGDSTDEEDRDEDGLRLRVRISRASEEEKWGVKWHKGIFKQSGRFIVDELNENGLLAAWNERQPPALRIAYGTRLLRINGVSPSSGAAAVATAKMRAELQRETMSAMFFRPGSADPPRKHWRAPGSVLVVPGAEATGSRGLACAAAVAAAQQLRHLGEVVSLDDLLESLGEAAAPLRAPEAEDLLQALRELQANPPADEELDDRGGAPEAGADPGVLAAPRAAASEAAAEIPAGRSEERAASEEALAAEAPAIATSAPAAQQEEAVLPAAAPSEVVPSSGEAAQEEARAPEQEEEEEAMPPVEASEPRRPKWIYSCRKCSTALFHDMNLQPHAIDGVQRESRNWVDEDGLPTCTSLFAEPMSWMGNLDGQTGKLVCGNAKCKQKLGQFSWHGLPCSCGNWQSPAFQLHAARLDCLPVGRRLRGPAPEAKFG